MATYVTKYETKNGKTVKVEQDKKPVPEEAQQARKETAAEKKN